MQEKIKEMAKEYGIETKVKFLGLREDIPQLLQAMDLFLFPSLFEGLPVTLVEAQAAGLPCVISDSRQSQSSGVAGDPEMGTYGPVICPDSSFASA